MDTSITLIEASPQVNSRLSVVQNLLPSVDTNNKKQRELPISEILKNYSQRFDHALAARVLVPLGHISLAAELLESLSEDKDLKMCLDVITRNSIRIDKLLNEFHSFGGGTEEAKAETYYIH